MGSVGVRESLERDLRRLRDEQTLELSLDSLDQLVTEPTTEPYLPRRGPNRAGVDDLVLTLSAVERLPEKLRIAVSLAPEGSIDVPVSTAERAMRQRANDLASEAWREAMAIRSMGRRQLPMGIAIGVTAAGAAYAAAFFAAVVDTAAARGALIVAAMIALTVAWVVGWVVVEAAILDWRQPARRAAACELLATATLTVTTDDREAPPA